ncbi:E3 ubiquitin-protein ligase goliath-like [Leptinotarsa decemlineata]|uniref:E3 ubiquitin-protein ligase goliath-like n=1 Tax=Leptinotarsa decemlineata TaxID=7539 RepID=UPI003D30BE36
MTLQFHPLVFGVMLVVAAGTVAYTLWTSSRQYQRYEGHQSTPSNYCVGYDTNKSKEPPRKRKNIDQCCICLGKLVGDLRILPCKHEFHSNCISQWLVGNDTCPLCRKTERL